MTNIGFPESETVEFKTSLSELEDGGELLTMSMTGFINPSVNR